MSKVSAAAGNGYRVIGLRLGGWLRPNTDAMAAALPDAARYLATLERAYPNISVPVRAAGKSQGDLA
ncbi:hypothetical protein ACFSGX_02320 [Sphingomonas arantia]|uniref:Uncharacterized protein n=1 Tax=Sphingomonas arantia TaxID=1460676 RepID=A0ABW4TX75_9SPHN